jgi:hypothetical protein
LRTLFTACITGAEVSVGSGRASARRGYARQVLFPVPLPRREIEDVRFSRRRSRAQSIRENLRNCVTAGERRVYDRAFEIDDIDLTRRTS